MAKLATSKMAVTHYGRTAFVTSFFAFFCSFSSFVSPYWIQSWSRIHTPFDRLGLWEFCLDGFIHRLDPKMKAYFGCWWIFAPEYLKMQDFLQPWWFRLVQLGMSFTIIIHLVGVILFLVYIGGCIRHPERRALISKLLAYGMAITACMLFCVSVIFGVRCSDQYWMPNPELNYPSWSYGLAVLSGFWSFFATLLMWVQKDVDRKNLALETYDFPLHSISREKLAASASTII